MKLTIRDLRLAVQLKLYASAKWIKKKIIKIIACNIIVLKYRKIQRQGKSANVYRSTSKRKSNSFFSHEKKNPTTTKRTTG